MPSEEQQIERLTAERGAITWRLFHIGWYVNLACVAAAVMGAMWFVKMLMISGSDAPVLQTLIDVSAMMGFFIIAAILLMGAGLSRYQARLEGQHLELKLAIRRVSERVAAIQARLDGEYAPPSSGAATGADDAGND